MPAFERKSQPRSTIRWTITRGDGHLYVGSSITNGGVAPRRIVRFSTRAAAAATTIPSRYMQKRVRPRRPTSPPTKVPLIRIY